MLKHLIEFDGKQIALDKREITAFYQAVEPYFVACAMGLNDVDIPNFVKEYNKDISESRHMVKQDKPIAPTTTSKKQEAKKEHYEDNIYDMSRYRKNA